MKRSHKSTGKVERLDAIASSRLKRFHDGEGRQPTKGAVLTTLEVAQRMGISEQLVRKLEASAFGKLRKFGALPEMIE